MSCEQIVDFFAHRGEIMLAGDDPETVLMKIQRTVAVLAQGGVDYSFDTRKCHDAIAARGAAAIIPPRRNEARRPRTPCQPRA